MITLIKKVICIITILFIWLLPLSIIDFGNFVSTFKQPLYTYIILWMINLLFLSISTFNILKDKPINNQYIFILIVNYLINPLFNLFIFNFKNIVYALISLFLILITGNYLLVETKKLDRKSSLYIIPYLVLIIYLIITMIYIMYLL